MGNIINMFLYPVLLFPRHPLLENLRQNGGLRKAHLSQCVRSYPVSRKAAWD